MKNQKGQTILILILVMTVALGIGLSVIQRSLSDISTSTRIEQSSRAYSAAEAGIEKAIQSNGSITSPIALGNNSTISDVKADRLPVAGQALEYLPVAKEDLAQVWLADPDTLARYYTPTELGIYWGNTQASGREQPALEVKIIYQDASGYVTLPFYIDPVDGSEGRISNRFSDPSVYAGSCGGYSITTSLSPAGTTNDRSFKCMVRLSGLPNTDPQKKLVLLRARILYSSTSQPFAVQPLGGGSLPPQARLFTATGVSGETQRKVQVFRLDKVVPYYFDYAIFSADEINK